MVPETLYLTVNILDRFLSVKQVRRSKLQLVGVAALSIAAKYEETDNGHKQLTEDTPP